MGYMDKKQLSQAIGKKIKVIREKQKLSQEELGEKAGLHRTYIGYIEVGRYTPSVYTLFRIANALGVELKELV